MKPALYATHDDSAGEPILAPENGEGSDIVVKYGDEKPYTEPKGYLHAALHLFEHRTQHRTRLMRTVRAAGHITMAKTEHIYCFTE